jgi:broad specificity phosphatase PhoE
LRHAESANPHVFHGAESDVGLSERGVHQAKAVATVLKGYEPEVLISSAMRRAILTATPIAQACKLDITIEPNLHERKVGILSGAPFTRDGIWDETMARWLAGETGYASEGAESFDDIRNRLLPVWERVTTTHAGKSIVMVAHGAAIKVLLLSILAGHTVADWKRLGAIRNVAVTELHLDGGWQVRRFNEAVIDE